MTIETEDLYLDCPSELSPTPEETNVEPKRIAGGFRKILMQAVENRRKELGRQWNAATDEEGRRATYAQLQRLDNWVGTEFAGHC